jgi:hypothetical protein
MTNSAMPKKSYDLTETTRLLLEMSENCIPKDGNAYEDPNRAEKYDALNAAIDLINNPSLLTRWISVKDRLPPYIGKKILVVNGHGNIKMMAFWNKVGNNWTWLDCDGHFNNTNDITHWMPLPEVPKEEYK